MSIKAKEAARRKRQNEKLRKMYEAERQNVAGYEEVSKVQSAYIAILLKKLGATEKNPVTITKDEVTQALIKDDVRVGVADVGVLKVRFESSPDLLLLMSGLNIRYIRLTIPVCFRI